MDLYIRTDKTNGAENGRNTLPEWEIEKLRVADFTCDKTN